jgi:hypothetical protein
MLGAIINDDSIPDYRMAKHKSEKTENLVRFYQKDAKKLALAYAKKSDVRKTTSPRKRTQSDLYD